MQDLRNIIPNPSELWNCASGHSHSSLLKHPLHLFATWPLPKHFLPLFFAEAPRKTQRRYYFLCFHIRSWDLRDVISKSYDQQAGRANSRPRIFPKRNPIPTPRALYLKMAFFGTVIVHTLQRGRVLQRITCLWLPCKEKAAAGEKGTKITTCIGSEVGGTTLSLELILCFPEGTEKVSFQQRPAGNDNLYCHTLHSGGTQQMQSS